MAVSEEECSSAKSGSSGPSSSSSSASRYYLSKCVFRGTVVLHVLHAHIRSPSSKDIVFGKETSIELVVIDEDGNVQSVFDQPVFGTIKDLAILPWNEKFRAVRDPQLWGKDLLVATSDSGKLSLLTFCNEMHRFVPVQHIQLSNPGNQMDFPGRKLAVDSSGCYIAASASEDELALFTVSMTGSDIIDKMIICHPKSEGTECISRDMQKTSICDTIWSMCFISLDSAQPSKEPNPVLAIILQRRGERLNELLLLEWNVEALTTSVISKYDEDGSLAHSIVEVPNSHGRAFLFRDDDVLLMDFRDPLKPCCVCKTRLNLPVATEEQTSGEDSSNGGRTKKRKLNEKLGDYGHKYICSWSWEPDNNNDEVRRMIFCVNTGEFFMIEVFFNPDIPKVNLSECLYKDDQPCKELLWVEGGYLAAILKVGDGVVLKLENGRLFPTDHRILNIAPILDVAHNEKHDQMFACCGVAPEGSLRIIQSGISVQVLLTTSPDYGGLHIHNIWTVRMKVTDSYHSFLVLSFAMGTRILSTGLKLTDVTDEVGFEHDVCTLACGLVSDGVLAQIYQSTVKLCLPTLAAYSEGISENSPICTCWSPIKLNIIMGAVGHEFIVVSTSNPWILFILKVRCLSGHEYEISEMQRFELQNELSCISIPRQKIGKKHSNSSISEKNSFVIGTHRPSVEVWSVAPDGKFIRVAHTTIPLISIPQDVHLVFSSKYYVLTGLRNGMLLRFEWPADSSHSMTKDFDKRNDLPSVLQLIAIRHIGSTPVFLVPLDDTLDADIIALSNRSWLLHSAGHGLSYTSVSIQPSSSHVTPFCTKDFPKGLFFYAEDKLHLVEMAHKRLNTGKFGLKGTLKEVLCHTESQMLLVMRAGLNHDGAVCLSDICCVNPLSGSILSSFELNAEGRCMELVRFGGEEVLVVGFSQYSGPAIMPSGEAVSTTDGLLVLRLIKVQNSDRGPSSSSLGSSPEDNSSDETWQLKMIFKTAWDGIPLAICSYLDQYFLVSRGNFFHVCGFEVEDRLRGTGMVRVIRHNTGRTRSMIRSLTAYGSRIAVGNDSDGILVFSLDENLRKMELLYADPSRRLVADCILMDDNTAVVSDRKGSIAVLCSDHLGDNASPEFNLRPSCAYFIAEVAMSIRKGSYYRLPADDGVLSGATGPKKNIDLLQNAITASTLLGSIMMFVPLSREEYELLKAVQARLVVDPLTQPVLGNDHDKFRSRENPDGVPKMLDGDMLIQFLELTRKQQDSILTQEMGKEGVILTLEMQKEEIFQLLERVHYALN